MIAGVVAWACLGWLFQPWSAYSPYGMLKSLDPRKRVEVFRSVDEILPYRVVRAPAEPRPLDRREAPLDALYAWDGERKLVETFLEDAAVTGLMVIQDGGIAHERYRLGATADSRLTTFSLAKGVVAALVGVAQHEGLIASLDDPLETYAPAYAGRRLGETSLRDLLAMAAGTAFDDSYASLGSDIYGLYLQSLVLGGDPDRLAARTRRVGPPGEAFDFASPNTQALAAAVSAVYDAPLAQVVEQKLWGPLGMTADATWSQSREGPLGVALAFCCWNATLQDIARFGEFLRRDGTWGGRRLLPEGWVGEAAQPSAFALPDPLISDPDDELGPWGYGLHVYVPDNARGELLLAGEYGQYLWIDRRRRTVVAMTAADPGWRERRWEATAVLRQIVATAAGD